jgi:hypothetical protein
VNKFYKDRARKKIKVQTLRVKQTLALPDRADSVAKGLGILNGVFREVFSDENFVTLLRAESMTAIPEYLRPLAEGARDEHETR